jgi:hypothetical protein
MKRILRSFGLLVVCCLGASQAVGETFSKNFADNPLTNGWRAFGDASLFQWDSTNQHLQVTWDSTRPNSYFYQPLGTVLTRLDDFHLEFDLQLYDCISGNEPGKISPMAIALGFFNFANATNTGFGRGLFGDAPNVVEFDYFPSGFYEFNGATNAITNSTSPTFISSSGFSYAPSVFDVYGFALPTNQIIHIAMNYSGSNQKLATLLTINGALLFQPPDVLLADSFQSSDDFFVDTFSISSYSSFGDPYNSVLGHGTVDNIFVNIPPVQNFTGAFTNNVWQAQFRGRSNWLYTLERTVDFVAWTNISASVSFSVTNLFLQDTNPPANKAFYRVRSERP